MSFDPYGYQESTPPASGLGGDGLGAPPIQPDLAQARERVKLPGIFLIIVGAFNLLSGCYWGFELVRATMVPGDKMLADAKERTEQVGKMIPALKEPMDQQIKQMTPDSVKQQALLQSGGLGGVTLLASLVIIFGGARMLQLRSYGLCILASIVAAVPCVSFTACCCMGEIVGIWSLVVLLSTQVRMAFR